MKKNISRLRYLKKSCGFTLLEIMMVLGIIGIVVAIGSSVVINHLKLYNRLTSEHESFQNTRLSISTIVDKLRDFTRLELMPGEITNVRGYASSNTSDPALKILTNGPDSSYYINYNNGNLMIENDVLATGIEQPVIEGGSTGKTIRIKVTPAGNKQLPVSTEVRKTHYPSNVANISKI